MDMRPIGVFDSGLGGLTAVRELQQILPAENLIYFGDTARVPYGMRTQEELVAFCRQDVNFLRSFGLKAILIACGTATTAALPVLQAENAPDTEIILSATCAYPQDRWLICGTAGTLRGTAEKLEWKYLDWSKYPERPLDMVPLEGRCYCSEAKEFETGEWVRPEEQTDTGAGARPAPGPTLALYESLYRAIRLGEKQLITPEQVRRRIEVMQTCYIQNNIPFPENTLL